MLALKANGREFAALGNLYAAAGKNAPRAVHLAVKEVGQKGRTEMRRAVRAALGSQKAIAGRINRAVVGRVSSGAAGASYTVSGRGVIALKHLRSRQTAAGVMLPGVDRRWIGGAERMPMAFEAQAGHAGTRGDPVKRRATLGGRIVYNPGGRGSRALKTVQGLLVAKVFVSAKPRAAFFANAAKLPPVLSRILFAAVEGKLRSHRRVGAAAAR